VASSSAPQAGVLDLRAFDTALATNAGAEPTGPGANGKRGKRAPAPGASASAESKRGKKPGGDPCADTSRCAREPAPTSAQIAECRNSAPARQCPAEAVALIRCVQAHERCLANGRRDDQASLAACPKQVQALGACLGN
jgi:hypothetical protein